MSAKGEHQASIATQFATLAAKEAAAVALQSATSQDVIASRRVNEASDRLRLAWSNYIKLYGCASLSGESSPAGGKGKGRGSSPEDDNAADGEEGVVSREPQGGSGDAGGPRAMDLS